MARYGAVLNFRGPFPDGDGIGDLTARVSKDTRVLRPAYAPLGSQVLNQLLFQHSSRLYEQAAINRFVRHTHALVVGILQLQPSGNLFRRPVQHQFTRNDFPELGVSGQKAGLGSEGRFPRLLIGFTGSIGRAPAMAGHLPVHCGRRAIQTFGDGTNRRAASDPAGDVFPFLKCECAPRTVADERGNPTMTLQQKVNDWMCLAKSAANRMQRLSRLPTTPDLNSLRCRESCALACGHKTP